MAVATGTTKASWKRESKWRYVDDFVEVCGVLVGGRVGVDEDAAGAARVERFGGRPARRRRPVEIVDGALVVAAAQPRRFGRRQRVEDADATLVGAERQPPFGRRVPGQCCHFA